MFRTPEKKGHKPDKVRNSGWPNVSAHDLDLPSRDFVTVGAGVDKFAPKGRKNHFRYIGAELWRGICPVVRYWQSLPTKNQQANVRLHRDGFLQPTRHSNSGADDGTDTHQNDQNGQDDTHRNAAARPLGRYSQINPRGPELARLQQQVPCCSRVPAISRAPARQVQDIR